MRAIQSKLRSMDLVYEKTDSNAPYTRLDLFPDKRWVFCLVSWLGMAAEQVGRLLISRRG